MDKFERKFGRYAIKNLSLILVICYAVGYLMSNIEALSPYLNYLTLNPYYICRGQIWRLVTWIVIPPSAFDLLTLVTLFFYYSIGHTLERTWGDFLYNIYIFSGMIFTVLGAFAIYGYFAIFSPDEITLLGIEGAMLLISRLCITTYYINMSIFLAFACTFPDAMVLLMFIIPVKIKYLGVIYGLFIIYEFYISDPYSRVMIFTSLLNFIIFFLMFRKSRIGLAKMRVKQAVRRREFNKDIKSETRVNNISKHKCAICGRTEIDSPDLDFRFCSKCNGNYEYCSEHLFSHKHVE